MSLAERMAQACSELAAGQADAWKRALERELRGMDAVSSRTLLDLLGVAPTTGNARRLAGTMRGLGFVPIKSRRLMPGGFRDTVIRGWARPPAGKQTNGQRHQC
jgi:hypothetical protein